MKVYTLIDRTEGYDEPVSTFYSKREAQTRMREMKKRRKRMGWGIGGGYRITSKTIPDRGLLKRNRNPRAWHTITSRMVGKYLEGFGNVLARDVGKKYYVEDGSYFVENDAQMAARLAKSNPAARIGTKLTKVRIKVGKRTVNGMAKRVGGKVKVYVTPGVAKGLPKRYRRNPRTFRDLVVGEVFEFAGSIAGGHSFLGQSRYRKTGPRTYMPADLADAERALKYSYSGYPDILKKLKGNRLKKSLTLRVGSTSAKVQ